MQTRSGRRLRSPSDISSIPRMGQKTHCECGQIVSKPHMQRHLNSKKHEIQLKMKQQKNKNNALLSDFSSAKYIRCECNVIISPKLYIKHLATQVHKKAMDRKNDEQFHLCSCGIYISQTNKEHKFTQKHIQQKTIYQARLSEISEVDEWECRICYNEQINPAIKCKTCCNPLCYSCYLLCKRCPFCRTQYS